MQQPIGQCKAEISSKMHFLLSLICGKVSFYCCEKSTRERGGVDLDLLTITCCLLYRYENVPIVSTVSVNRCDCSLLSKVMISTVIDVNPLLFLGRKRTVGVGSDV